MSGANRCPVCQARFRDSRICSRCGADLERLMFLVAKAWRMREEARTELTSGEYGQALALAAGAQQAQGTPAGAGLRLLCAWLQAQGPPAPRYS